MTYTVICSFYTGQSFPDEVEPLQCHVHEGLSIMVNSQCPCNRVCDLADNKSVLSPSIKLSLNIFDVDCTDMLQTKINQDKVCMKESDIVPVSRICICVIYEITKKTVTLFATFYQFMKPYPTLYFKPCVW